MKPNKFFLMVFLIVSLTSLKNFSQDKKFGLGVMLGEPTGLSGKYWLENEHAIDFGLAYSFAHPNKTFSLHADYLFHLPNVIKSQYRFPVYYGFGARIHFGNNDGNTLGARGVIGILWIPDSLPIDTFIELAPVFNLFPETSLHLDFAIGGRYYFE
jgi:hypothetical protein